MAVLVMFVCLPLLLTFGAAMGALALIKRNNQDEYDHNQKTYVLTFPDGLDAEAVTDWLRSISGTLIPKRLGPASGTPTIAFEVWATAGRIRHRLKVPWRHADYITQQLNAHIPGLRFDEEDEWPKVKQWTHAVEVGLKNSGRPLAIKDVEQASRTLLKTTDGLKDGETILVQWVIASLPPQPLPEHGRAKTDDPLKRLVHGDVLASRDEIAQRREKLAEPNYLGVLRIGTIAPTRERAVHMQHNIRKGLMSLRGTITKWKPRLSSKPALAYRMAHAAAPLHFGAQLSASEVAALVFWPVGNPFLSGLPSPLARSLPLPCRSRRCCRQRPGR